MDHAKVRGVDNDGQNEIIGGGNNKKVTAWKYQGGVYKKVFISGDLEGFIQGIDAGDLNGRGNNEVKEQNNSI